MLSDAELTAMRADAERMLPATGYILSVARTSDGQGGFTSTWGTASTTAYRLDPLRGEMLTAGAALAPYHGYQLTLPYDTAITTAHRFQDADGNVYTVQSVDAGKSWAVSKRARLERA